MTRDLLQTEKNSLRVLYPIYPDNVLLLFTHLCVPYIKRQVILFMMYLELKSYIFLYDCGVTYFCFYLNETLS